ncbi:hypothetical protein BRE01_22090 [Brevibacillus reuszeri]|uniref:Uncharacterized protein n=1 Tax=Brevibacillus reuszeri TaxID=54915 RepID=A0A0K9YWY5_9BACL|nr:hypothetical protein [Brevibacillus reuszeri]KNB73152.1 hypothetical protein ADS79_04025 [Brevibacillus reuszeri]MED1856746.1 hypothetical protein [Brevibacillus reuszeri]GED68507.1 hypothetical protein BRE01_22090 [Brevibacillus reuszeri]
MAVKLEELLNWKKRPILDGMLDEGISPNKCAEWLRGQGFSISTPTVYTYDKKRKKTIYQSITREGTGSVREIDPETKKFKKQSDDTFPVKEVVTKRSKAKVRADLEMLDVIIQKGMDTLMEMPVISPQTAIKAIEMKHKLTGGQHGGLTMYGVEEIKHREAGREAAITAVLLKFIPEEKHEEVFAEMERATREYYASVGLGEIYDQIEEEESLCENSP